MFKVDRKSSNYNDNGTVLCKVGKMFHEDSLISNIAARCDENAEWSFNSSKLHCYRGLVLAYKVLPEKTSTILKKNKSTYNASFFWNIHFSLYFFNIRTIYILYFRKNVLNNYIRQNNYQKSCDCNTKHKTLPYFLSISFHSSR